MGVRRDYERETTGLRVIRTPTSQIRYQVDEDTSSNEIIIWIVHTLATQISGTKPTWLISHLSLVELTVLNLRMKRSGQQGDTVKVFLEFCSKNANQYNPFSDTNIVNAHSF